MKQERKRVETSMPVAMYDFVSAMAQNRGMSVSQYINNAVIDKAQADSAIFSKITNSQGIVLNAEQTEWLCRMLENPPEETEVLKAATQRIASEYQDFTR